MDIREFMKTNTVILDGGTGSLLQAAGLPAGTPSEAWNLTNPDALLSIHRAYYEAGSHVVNSNTFGVNLLKYSEKEAEALVRAAIKTVKKARDAASDSDVHSDIYSWSRIDGRSDDRSGCPSGGRPRFVSMDIGPTGKLLKPYGELPFEEAVRNFSFLARIAVSEGVDLFSIETMSDSRETKAALLGIREVTDLPVFVTNAYGEDGKLLTGATPEVMALLLTGLGADAVGANCSLGPEQLLPIVGRMKDFTALPLIFKPNAGLPELRNGQTVYPLCADDFAAETVRAVRAGIRIVGGCCGTTPEMIRKVAEKLNNEDRLYSEEDLYTEAKTAVSDSASATPKTHAVSGCTSVTSQTHTVSFAFGGRPLIIGERINPTGRRSVKNALTNGDFSEILEIALQEQADGANLIDVNAGLPGINEPAVLSRLVEELQSVTNVPLCIDSADPKALEAALRVYNGKALINSVSGRQDVMDEVFPLAKKYGGVMIALLLDENEIPESAEERVKIAEKIMKEGEKYGFSKEDFLFDALVMALGADPQSAEVTLDTVSLLSSRGLHSVLGISNLSYGLPNRRVLDSAFLMAALERGLTAAFLNPASAEMRGTYQSFLALHGKDDGFNEYLRFSELFPAGGRKATDSAQSRDRSAADSAQKREKPPISGSSCDTGVSLSSLSEAVFNGISARAGELTRTLLKNNTGTLILIQDGILPALEKVGRGYEEKTVYLPKLLQSARAAEAAFAEISGAEAARREKAGALRSEETAGSESDAASSYGESSSKGKILLATVKGDIHDIGKNIVKMLLQNYGYDVTDLGKDVSPARILETVKAEGIRLVGLSALMTTTLPAMEETVALLKKEAPSAKIIASGAVLTKEYAVKIGADFYAKDAMETVRIAESVF